MPSALLHRLNAPVLLIIAPTLLSAQMQRVVSTSTTSTLDTPTPHPLSWWTKNPLRLDAGGQLKIGYKAGNGKLTTPRDYRVKQQVTSLGTIAGRRIIQIITTINPGPRIISLGWATAEEPPTQWKSLLVQNGVGDQYVEIYELQAESGAYAPLEPAAIHSVGSQSILETFDPDSGNGGGCTDGYWWFDETGAHAVDFSPLKQAISRALPHNGTDASGCWGLLSEKAELQFWVQRADAECHACGGLGTIYAQYKIQRGVAIPISVRFEPESQK